MPVAERTILPKNKDAILKELIIQPVYVSLFNYPNVLTVRDVRKNEGHLEVLTLAGWRIPFEVWTEARRGQ